MSCGRILWIGCSCLFAVWSLAAGGIWIARSLTPRAEPVIELVREQPLAGLAADERRAFLDRLADEIDRLQPGERRTVQMSAEVRALYPQMTADERRNFLARTRPPGSEAIARAFDPAATLGRIFRGGRLPADPDASTVPAPLRLEAPHLPGLPQERRDP